MRRLDRIMVCLYLAFAVLPFVVKRLGASDHPIFGAVPPTPHPSLGFRAVLDETYQKAYTAWFEARLGFKGYAVTTDNAILLHAFGETKVGSPVVLGDDGVLFKDEDISYFNKTGEEWLPSQARVDAFADKIAALQQLLAAQHRALVPLIIPSKTSVFRAQVPARWTRALGEPRPSDIRIYRALVAALAARHVAYVDARELFTSGAYDRALLWTPQARHWSDYGACLAMGEVVRTYDTLTGDTLPPDPCAVTRQPQPATAVDYDLAQLLNAWRPPPPTPTLPTIAFATPPARPRQTSMLAIGTSFSWHIIYYGTDSHLFDKVTMDFYNRTFVDGSVHTEVHPHTPAWTAEVVGRDLYVLDLLETFLFSDDNYAEQFVTELTDALAPPVAAATTGAEITRTRDLGVAGGEHYFELWGTFPGAEAPYTGIVTCDGVARRATVYYQSAQQINVKVEDPGAGACDRTQTPPRTLGVSCTFHLEQGAIGTPAFGPRRVCRGPQGESGQDAAGNCVPEIPGC